VNRTFPHSSYFFSNDAKFQQRGLKTLHNVLTVFVKYDSLETKCGYVQGMNFIAGEFCYHANAEFSFVLFMKFL